MTEAEMRILEALDKHGPLFNGSLASHADAVWNSRLFGRMQRAGLLRKKQPHLPYDLTCAGRKALTDSKQLQKD